MSVRAALSVTATGPVDALPVMANGVPFTWPGAEQFLDLPDRTLRLRTLRSYFPSVAEDADRAIAVQWVHEQRGNPPGPSAIVSARLDGSEMRTIYPPPRPTIR